MGFRCNKLNINIFHTKIIETVSLAPFPQRYQAFLAWIAQCNELLVLQGAPQSRYSVGLVGVQAFGFN